MPNPPIIIFIVAFSLILLSKNIYASNLVSISPNVDTGYRIMHLSGNESCWASVSLSGNYKETITINTKAINQRTCEVCDDKGNCQNVLISPPSVIPVFDSSGNNIVNLSISLNRFSFSISDILRKSFRNFRIGWQSIVLAGDSVYNATIINVTQENKFAHLSIGTQSPYNKIVAYWNFDKDQLNSVITAYDLSNNSIDGTYVDTPNVMSSCTDPSPDKTFIGCSYNYNTTVLSVAEGINLGSSQAKLYLGAGNFTITAWVRKNDTGTSTIIKRGTSTLATNVNQQYLVSILNNGSLNFVMGNGTTAQAISGGTINNNEWTHVAVMVNETSSMNIYINGVLVNSRIRTLVGVHVQNQTYIGKASVSIGANTFMGQMDEIMIFNNTITDAELLAIYNNDSQRFYPQGTMLFRNLNLQNNNTVNISIGSTVLMSSNISASINNGSFVRFDQNGNILNYQVESNLTDANLTIMLEAGNSTNFFYTPYIFGNITINEYYTPPPVAQSLGIKILPSQIDVSPNMVLSRRWPTYCQTPYIKLGESIKCV